jgi:hypothetical protein
MHGSNVDLYLTPIRARIAVVGEQTQMCLLRLLLQARVADDPLQVPHRSGKSTRSRCH